MTRIRDNGTVANTVWSVRMTDSPGGPVQQWDWPYSWRDYDVMTDVVTPGFKRASREGVVIITPMTKLVSRQRSTGASASESSTTSWQWSVDHVNYFRGGVDAGLVIESQAVRDKVTRVESLAITRAYAQVGSPNVETLTEIAELKETLNFLMSPVNSMVKFTLRAKSWLDMYKRLQANYARRVDAYHRYVSRLRPGAKRRPPPDAPVIPPFKVGPISATDIPSFWLAYRYGILPLIYTFQGIQKNLQEQIDKSQAHPPRATARGVWEEGLPSRLYESTGGLHVGNVVFPVENALEAPGSKVKARAGVLYAPQIDWRTKWGIHLHYIPVALYEVVPLSFVADWFYTGSDAYKALTAHLRAVTILGAWVSTRTTIDGSIVDTLTPVPGATASPLRRPYATISIDHRRRRAASLSDVSVQAKIDLNAFRIADGLALISQFIHGRMKTSR